MRSRCGLVRGGRHSVVLPAVWRGRTLLIPFGYLLEFGAGLCACLGFNMAPFGSFFLCCCFVLWRLNHTPHLTMAGQIQPSTVPTGPATVLSRKCVWDCPLCSDTPLSQNSAHKINRNKNKNKGMRPFCWKSMRCGFCCCMDNTGTVGSRCKQMSEGVWKEC